MNSANKITGYFHSKLNVATEYFSLRENNLKLQEENARYRNMMRTSFKSDFVTGYEIKDTIHHQQYYYVPARIVNNSVNKKMNYLTIDKGAKNGVKPDMGVVCENGIVGIVYQVSENYSTVISQLNTELGLSARIKKNGFFGTIIWDGYDYRKVKLDEIPNHTRIAVGDTIVTSGFSSVFPENLFMGTIERFSGKSGANFYDITVRLSTNFKTVSYVYVIKNFLKEEQAVLEQSEVNKVK